MEGGVSGALIRWGYVIVSLGLILSPFFIVHKFKRIKWRYIFLAYFLSILIFLGVWFFYDWFDQYLYNNVYNSGWVMEELLTASLYQILFLYVIASLSPFFIAKIKYKRFNKKRFFFSLLFSIIIAIALFVALVYYMAWGWAKVGELYF